jgi:hypothetical protein
MGPRCDRSPCVVPVRRPRRPGRAGHGPRGAWVRARYDRSPPPRHHHRLRNPRRQRRAFPDGGPGRSDRPARPLRRAEDAALQPRAGARARRPRQGRRRARLLRGDRRRGAVHQGLVPVAGRQAHRHVRPLLDGGRRAGLPRHRARPARLRAEVLHRRRQLRHGRQQHAGLLRPRPVEVPGLHPLPEATARHGPAFQRHAVGLLDAVARERSPGDDPHVRPRDPGQLAAHGRLLEPHLLVGERRRRALLGQVPRQDQPGDREPHRPTRPRAWPGRTATTIAATCTTPSPRATRRSGRSPCR